MNRFFFTLVLTTFACTLFGQSQKGMVLDLPFFDNFTYSGSVKLSSHWVDSTGPEIESVTNSGQTNNVLVFDGRDSKGGFYDDSLALRVPTDSLISHQIDLGGYTARDSVRLTFTWQVPPKGMPDPSLGESFQLYFRDPSKTWIPIWSAPTNIQPSTLYTQSLLLSTPYLYDSLQLKFLRVGPSYGDSIEWYLNMVEITKTMSLPFWEDFSVPSTFSQKFKTNTGVFVNNALSVNPPSSYVASFDGLDDAGNPHGPTPYNFGLCDSLVSLPIDLSQKKIADSLLFSFYFQRAGSGEDPDRIEGDSLILWFYNARGNWVSVWNSPLNDSISRVKFLQALIVLKDSSFFHPAFRFKFQNYAKKSGRFDLWHVDYINLDVEPADTNQFRRRVGNRVFFYDLAISQRPASIITPYTAVPYSHVSEFNFLKESFSFSVANMAAGELGDFTNFTLRLINGGTTSSYTSSELWKLWPGDSVSLTSRSINKDSLPSWTVPDSPFQLENKVFLTFATQGDNDGYNVSQNDTVTTTLNFDNYYAYDDGSYERTLKVQQENGGVCLRYKPYANDTLTAIDIAFPYDGFNLNGLGIKVKVWPDDKGKPSLKPVSVMGGLVSHGSIENPFTRFYIDPVAVKANESFYIGYVQEKGVSNAIRIGMDLNNEAITEYYYFNNDDQNWTQFLNRSGAPMMRPVFGTVTSRKVDNGETSQNPDPFVQLAVFPNPNQSGELNLSTKFDRVEVFDMFLRPLGTQYYTDKINIENLQPGVYIVSAYLKGKRQAVKFIYQPY